MAVTMLSEYSTSENQEESDYGNLKLKESELGFVEDIVLSPSDSDIRYLKYYERLDSKRTASWLKSKPKDLSERNLERLKLLIKQNLMKRVRR
jgi:hypothetical protein